MKRYFVMLALGGAVCGAACAQEPAETNAPAPAAESHTDVLMDAGVQYESEKEYAAAEKAYLRALEKNPESFDIRFRLGVIYILMERYRDAADVLSKLAADAPDSASVHNNLAWIYCTGRDIKNGGLALFHAREALLLNPDSSGAWNTLAEAYYVLGRYDEAKRSCEHAIQLARDAETPPQEELRQYEEQLAKIKRSADAFSRWTLPVPPAAKTN